MAFSDGSPKSNACCEFAKIVAPPTGLELEEKVTQCSRTGLINGAPPVLVKPRHEKSRSLAVRACARRCRDDIKGVRAKELKI